MSDNEEGLNIMLKYLAAEVSNIPEVIVFGEGRYGVGYCRLKSGEHGVIISPNPEGTSVIGSAVNSKGKKYLDKDDVYLQFNNRESLNVVMRALEKVELEFLRRE